MSSETAPDREAFCAGERPDHVALFVADDALEADASLPADAEPVDGGQFLVVPGRRGRALFAEAVGEDVMAFARAAGDRTGRVDVDLLDGTCPDADGGTHGLAVLFSFVEAQNEELGGRYAAGDVVHAYVRCRCGTRYADRWVAGADRA